MAKNHRFLFGGELDWLKPPAGHYPMEFYRAFKEHGNHQNLFIYDEYENLLYSMDPKPVFRTLARRINRELKLYITPGLKDMESVHGPAYVLEVLFDGMTRAKSNRAYDRLEDELLKAARKQKRANR